MTTNHVVDEITRCWRRTVLHVKCASMEYVVGIVLHQNVEKLGEIAVEVISAETSLCGEEGLQKPIPQRRREQERVDEVPGNTRSTILLFTGLGYTYCTVG